MANYDYKNIGGNIDKVNAVIQKLEGIKNSWDEACSSNEPFYNQFNTKIGTLITNLTKYKGYLESQGKELDKYAKWVD